MRGFFEHLRRDIVQQNRYPTSRTCVHFLWVDAWGKSHTPHIPKATGLGPIWFRKVLRVLLGDHNIVWLEILAWKHEGIDHHNKPYNAAISQTGHQSNLIRWDCKRKLEKISVFTNQSDPLMGIFMINISTCSIGRSCQQRDVCKALLRRPIFQFRVGQHN